MADLYTQTFFAPFEIKPNLIESEKYRVGYILKDSDTDILQNILDRLEALEAGGSGGTVDAVWGAITGSLSRQSDLVTVLGTKSDKSYTDEQLELKADKTTVTSLDERLTEIEEKDDGEPVWGSIKGTLTNQTDLNAALISKADKTAVTKLDTRVTKLEAGGGSGGGTVDAVWGLISGTLSEQTDLQDALNTKVDKSYTDEQLELKADKTTVTSLDSRVTKNESDIVDLQQQTPGEPVWGAIKGTLTNQTDLNTRLNNMTAYTDAQIKTVNDTHTTTTDMNALLDKKEDKGTIDAALALKADLTYVDTELATKANNSTVTAIDSRVTNLEAGGSGGGGEADSVAFVNITGNPNDNTNLATALSNKQNKLTASTGIAITGDVVSSTVKSLDNVFGSPLFNSGKVDFNNMTWAQEMTQADVTGNQNNKYRMAYITAQGTKNGPHGTVDYDNGMAILFDFYQSNFAKGTQILIEPQDGGIYYRTRAAIGGWSAWSSMLPKSSNTNITGQAITLDEKENVLNMTRVRNESWTPNASQYILHGSLTITNPTENPVTNGVSIDAVGNYQRLSTYTGEPFRVQMWDISTGEVVGMITANKYGILMTTFKALPVGEYAFTLNMTIW